MIKTIEIKKDTNADKILFFDSLNVENHKVIPLYGANGVGKTTLLKEIQFALFERQEKSTSDSDDFTEKFERSRRRSRAGIEHDPQIELTIDSTPTIYYKYRNSTDNFGEKEIYGFDPVSYSMRWDAQSLSEGQSIVYSVKDLLTGMLKSNSRHESFIEDDIHGIVLLDEIDSGLSLDNLDEMLKIIRRVEKQGRNIQFFLSFNNPYVIKYFPDVLSMYNGEWIHFNNTDEMLEDLMSHKKMLDKARKSRGKYKIF